MNIDLEFYKIIDGKMADCASFIIEFTDIR